MILTGARVALSATESERRTLALNGTRQAAPPPLDLRGLLILPGLVNAHDHLEFNLFPRLGRGPYPNATAWAADVYRPGEDPVRRCLKVPKRERLLWGGIKNLLSGVTTVAHHNPYQSEVFNRRFPVRVLKRFGWAHSLHFSPDIAEHFRRTPAHAPFIVHAAEGTDSQARAELARLDEAGVLAPSTVVVHGVGIDAEGVRLMEERAASVVWCPSSNCFTLGRTLSDQVLDSRIPIALGTDSALTADGDLIDELRIAHQFVDPSRLYDMVTRDGARILRLVPDHSRDREEAGGSVPDQSRDRQGADFVVVADRGQTPAEALLDLRPELVFVGGRLKLISERMSGRVPPRSFRPIEVEGRGRYFIGCDVPRLDAAFRLAGRRVLA